MTATPEEGIDRTEARDRKRDWERERREKEKFVSQIWNGMPECNLKNHDLR